MALLYKKLEQKVGISQPLPSKLWQY